MQGLRDVLSLVVRDELHDPIEAELTTGLGASRWERSGGRNGSRLRMVLTPANGVKAKFLSFRRVRSSRSAKPARQVDRARAGS